MKSIITLSIGIFAIGLLSPAFAEDTIGFDFLHYPGILDFPIVQDTVIINGHVKFENNKAVGLGIGPGYQITVQVISLIHI